MVTISERTFLKFLGVALMYAGNKAMYLYYFDGNAIFVRRYLEFCEQNPDVVAEEQKRASDKLEEVLISRNDAKKRLADVKRDSQKTPEELLSDRRRLKEQMREYSARKEQEQTNNNNTNETIVFSNSDTPSVQRNNPNPSSIGTQAVVSAPPNDFVLRWYDAKLDIRNKLRSLAGLTSHSGDNDKPLRPIRFPPPNLNENHNNSQPTPSGSWQEIKHWRRNAETNSEDTPTKKSWFFFR